MGIIIGMFIYIATFLPLCAKWCDGPAKDLDRLRCYTKPQITYWDGPDGTRSTRSQYRSLLHCWPKDGCWLDSNGDAICWRVVKVKPQ